MSETQNSAPLENSKPVHSDETPKSRMNKLIISVAVLIVLLIAVVTSGVMIAYEKIPLKHEMARMQIEDIVMGLPFMPKTPKYVLRKTAQAHQNVKQVYMDLSMATTSEALAAVIGTNQFDATIRGSVDMTNEQYPKMSLNFMVTKDFEADLRTTEKNGYFKVNKIPPLFKSYLQLNDKQLSQLLNQWISYDVEPFESEARSRIAEYSLKKTDKEKEQDKKFNDYVNKEILPKVKMTQEKLNNKGMYKVEVPLTQTQAEKVMDFLSEDNKSSKKVDKPVDTMNKDEYKVNDFLMTMWVGQSDYYVHKTVMAMKIETEMSKSSSPSTMGLFQLPSKDKEEFDVVIVANFKDFNKTFKVEKPSKSFTTEEFYEKVAEVAAGGTSSSASPFGSSSSFEDPNESVADDLELLETAVLYYYRSEKELPATIADLIASKELPASYRTNMAKSKITYKVSKDGKKAFMYTMIPDTYNTIKPYQGIEITEGRSAGLKYYSQTQINTITKEMDTASML